MVFFKSKKKGAAKSSDDLGLHPTRSAASIDPSRSNSPATVASVSSGAAPEPTPAANTQTPQKLPSLSPASSQSSVPIQTPAPRHSIAPSTAPSYESTAAAAKVSDSKKGEEEEGILNILPSYHMYKSTVSRNLTGSQENFSGEPPIYEVTPTTSTAQSLVTSPLQSPPNELALSPVTSYHQPVQPQASATQTFNEASENLWENTILANAHKLKNLTDTNNKISDDLKLSIRMTEKMGQKGVEPVFVDPSTREYKQGNFIHGYVLLENTSDTPIAFDMVYVVFEGSTVVLENNNGVLNTKKPHTVYKFLNMIDLFASWSYANIDRVVTDNGDPHDWCPGETDPYDNTVLSIDVKRIFQPHVKYKRFFTFRVPDKLLDDACEMHDLTRHQEVPPSVGIPRTNKSSSGPNAAKSAVWSHGQSQRESSSSSSSNSPFHPHHKVSDASSSLANDGSDIKDFSFVDTSISYSVDARVVGKASDYGHKSVKENEYVVAKEVSLPIRVVPLSNPERSAQMYANSHETNLFYRAFVDCVKDKINLGRELLNLQPVMSHGGDAGGGIGSSSGTGFSDLTPMNSMDNSSSSFVKIRQLYDASAGLNSKPEVMKLKVPRKSVNEEQYQSFLTYKKKSITGSSKSSGILSLSTPKAEYHVAYQTPLRYRHSSGAHQVNNTSFQVPMELQFLNESGKAVNPPDIKDVSVELIVFTAKSPKHTIPVEISHELLFNDQEVEGSKRSGNDNFDAIVVRKFRNYLKEMSDLIKKIGPEIFLVENRLFNDMKSMAFLTTKYINLAVDDVLVSSDDEPGLHKTLSSIPWVAGESSEILSGYNSHYKRFSLSVDISKAQFKAGGQKGEYCLLPDFQSCLLVRLYYLRIGLKTSTNQILTVNVPVIVENLESM